MEQDQERQMTKEEMLEAKVKSLQARELKLKEAASKMKDDLSARVEAALKENGELKAAALDTKQTFDTQNVVNLIEIRNYIAMTPNNFSLPKDVVNTFNKMLLLVDKKIVKELLSDDFKEMISFKDAQAAVNAARKLSDIKSGLTEDAASRSVFVDDNGKVVAVRNENNRQ
jgi:hypothetical protein